MIDTIFIIILMDLGFPNTKFILLISESPLGMHFNHLKKNHDVFDFVFTYNWKMVDNKKYFYRKS